MDQRKEAGTRRRARRTAASTLAVLAFAAPAPAHDLFFRAPSYRLAPGSEAVIDVLSGTFSRSENAIERSRLADLTLVTAAGRSRLDLAGWSEAEPTSRLKLPTGEPGTYLVGAALHPRLLALPAKEFAAYLKEEGLDEVIARRDEQGRSNEPSRERYSKYLKALLQVGEATTDAYDAVLGYAAEIVPEQNPYRLKPGDTLVVRCLVGGQPWAGKVVFAGGRRGASDVRLKPQRLVTDASGRAAIRLDEAGVWYVKYVAMVERDEAEANYESFWSTLSFAVGLAAPLGRSAAD